MADVVHIRDHHELPKDRDWVLVEKTPSGEYVGNGSVAQGDGSPMFYISQPEDWESAIAHAVAWADRHGIPAIHVLGNQDA